MMRCVKAVYIGDVTIKHPDWDEVTLNVWMNPETQTLVGVDNMDVDVSRNFINDPYVDETRLVFEDTFSGLPK